MEILTRIGTGNFVKICAIISVICVSGSSGCLSPKLICFGGLGTPHRSLRSLCVVLTINQRLRRCAAVNADAFHNTDLHNAADDFFISRRSNR